MIDLKPLDIVQHVGRPHIIKGRLSQDMFAAVRIVDEIIGNTTSIRLVIDDQFPSADLSGRMHIRGILFHKMVPGMKGFMRYLMNRSEIPLAMVGVPNNTDIANLARCLPLTCTVDVSHLIIAHPDLFEILKPHLRCQTFDLTDELYTELLLRFV